MNNTEMEPMVIPYQKVGDYYLPVFTYQSEDHPIGHWGRMRRDYLMEHQPVYASSTCTRLLKYFVRPASTSS